MSSAEEKGKDITIDKAFGKVIRTLRESTGFSQEELAFRAHVHRTYVSQIERGLKSPSLVVIIRLANALEISAAELVRQATEEIEHL